MYCQERLRLTASLLFLYFYRFPISAKQLFASTTPSLYWTSLIWKQNYQSFFKTTGQSRPLFYVYFPIFHNT